jgi:hypothetical protein
MKRISIFLNLALAIPLFGQSMVRVSEQDARAISDNIQKRHLPYSTILDPVFASPESDEIRSYARAGDSAIWTGHYLAAESFRYRVTNVPDALDNAKRAIAGLRSLVDVTGTNLLARCLVPNDSPYANDIKKEEGRHGIYPGTLNGKSYFWIGNTSRDQYSGVFFGLGVAYSVVEDDEVRSSARELVTRMLEFLLRNKWFVVMPDGSISTVFTGHPDQRLCFLRIGSLVNPGRFISEYSRERSRSSHLVSVPIAFDVLDDHTSYFKFNLDTINLYNLVRLETNNRYRARYISAYNLLRRTTDDHGNAHFNMIDRALKGTNATRDAETRRLLDEWLTRPRRDCFRDYRNNPRYTACGEDKACQPIPIPERICTDFLWQRSPFLLFGGGKGEIEGAGIDYILPYWMGRYYGVIPDELRAPPRKPSGKRRTTGR